MVTSVSTRSRLVALTASNTSPRTTVRIRMPRVCRPLGSTAVAPVRAASSVDVARVAVGGGAGARACVSVASSGAGGAEAFGSLLGSLLGSLVMSTVMSLVMSLLASLLMSLLMSLLLTGRSFDGEVADADVRVDHDDGEGRGLPVQLGPRPAV